MVDRSLTLLRGLAYLVVALTLSACVLTGPPPRVGDPGTDVRIRNDTSIRLTLTEIGEDSGRDLVTHLAAGEERVTAWHFKDSSPVTLRANDDAGRLVFCHSYSYEELHGLNRRVVIVDGKLDCPK